MVVRLMFVGLFSAILVASLVSRRQPETQLSENSNSRRKTATCVTVPGVKGWLATRSLRVRMLTIWLIDLTRIGQERRSARILI